jgi:chromosome segregation protein
LLRLDRLKIHGFKSFSESTEVILKEGITAVVGPNGCGKSNIGDAINWVLGEQSAKSLRGSSMQDVIFNGSEGRKPLGMAEVSMHLSEGDEAKGDERREIVITRRLFRSGESEYLLNGKRSRLKDIQDLLGEARVGAQTYATIEQGRIDQILNAKPKDRRGIIEDAAGVSGFKHKRRLAELKLEATEANLLRVTDIVIEVKRQIDSVKRQAAKARRYQTLREELRTKGALRFAVRARSLEADLVRARETEERAHEADAAAAARLASLEAETLAERAAVDEERRSARDAAASLSRLEVEIGQQEAAVRTSRERIAEAEADLARLGAEAEALGARRGTLADELRRQHETVAAGKDDLVALETRRADKQAAVEGADADRSAARERVESLRRGLFESMNRLVDLRNRARAVEEGIERASAHRARVTAEREAVEAEANEIKRRETELQSAVLAHGKKVETLAEDLRTTEQRLDETRRRLEEASERLAAAKEREQSAFSRLRTLDDVATRFAGFSDGVPALLTAGRSQGLRTHGVVADFLEAHRDVEGAAEAYLGALLPAVILEDDHDTERAAALLRTEGAGRTHLLSRSQPAGGPAVGTPGNGSSRLPQEIFADPRVLGRLGDRLHVKKAANGVVHDRIGEAVLVESLKSALDLHRRYPGADYLTLEGDVVYASGVVAAGGGQKHAQGLLAHGRQTTEAKAAIEEAGVAVATHQAVIDVEKASLETLTRQVEVGRRLAESEGRRALELDLGAKRAEEDLERLARRLGNLDEERAALDLETERLRSSHAEENAAVAAAQQSHDGMGTELDGATRALDEVDGRLKVLQEEFAALRADLAGKTEQVAALEREEGRINALLGEADARLREIDREVETTFERSQATAELLATTEALLVENLKTRERMASEAAARERALEDRAEALRAREESLTGLRAELDAARTAVQEAQLARSGIEGERRHLDDLCMQELGFDAAEAIARVGEVPQELDAPALEAEIAAIKERIERLGPVNLVALEEFAGLDERYQFLTSQQKDLEDSIASLRETIKRINRSSREKFLSAFESIRTSYNEIFQVLFNGGKADLRLAEDDGEADVLECGIEMIAQPPGKRLGNVTLLSGGEKAMSAIALLFAIFRYQPSPFCLLDEVDAALDDVNVGRFTRMLREYAGHTQFILITHNKWSMESANLLYGITMQEPGISRLVSLKL